MANHESSSRFIGVMGVGRCGSSAVAGMLHKGGVSMGQNLIGPHERFNARGHYEDHEWHKLNRLIAYQYCLADVQDAIRNETVERYPKFANQIWCSDVLMATYVTAIEKHRQLAPAQAGVWGMKCIMLGLIWPYVGRLFDDVRIIVVERDREAVIRSRMEHSQMERQEAESLVDALQGGIDDAVRRHHGPMLKLHYEFVVRDPRSVASLFKSFTGLDSFGEELAAAHIDPTLNHHGEERNVQLDYIRRTEPAERTPA